MMFEVDLHTELREVSKTRQNVLPSVVAERAAALRWRLRRVDKNHCDGIAKKESQLKTGLPVEVKSVRLAHHDMMGRINLHKDSHRKLKEEEGIYAIFLYENLEHFGERILCHRFQLVDPADFDRWIGNGKSIYEKVRWDLVLDCEQ